MQAREPRQRIQNSSVEFEKQTNTQQKEYKVLDISRGGLCFESSTESFELNKTMKLKLQIDKQLIHQANARICYRNRRNPKYCIYGLSFLDKFIDNELLRHHN